MSNGNKLTHVSQAEKNIINSLVTGFVNAVHPLAIYLFGSVAENRAQEYSDYDFYMVMDDSTTERLFDICYKAHISIDDVNRLRGCDIMANRESKFNLKKNNRNTLEYDVYHKGVKLYERGK